MILVVLCHVCGNYGLDWAFPRPGQCFGLDNPVLYSCHISISGKALLLLYQPTSGNIKNVKGISCFIHINKKNIQICIVSYLIISRFVFISDLNPRKPIGKEG